jgi:hypothetical protein
MSASQYPGWIQLIISLWDQYWLWIIIGCAHRQASAQDGGAVPGCSENRPASWRRP